AQRRSRQIEVGVEVDLAVNIEPLDAELVSADVVGAGDAAVKIKFAAAENIARHLQTDAEPAAGQMARHDEMGVVARGEPGGAAVPGMLHELVPGNKRLFAEAARPQRPP